MKNYKPNYKNGSIVNLMSSIGQAFGVKSQYNNLKLLKSSEIEQYSNVILLVIDGLGYNYVKRYGKNSFIIKYLKGEITSVFPSTTPSAIASFLNGTPPLQHGVLGYYFFVPEFKGNVAALKNKLRETGYLLSKKDFKEMYNVTPFSNNLNAETYHLDQKEVIDSIFTREQAGKAKIIGHCGVKDCFKKIIEIIKSNKKRKYFYVHLPKHDELCHYYGTKSSKVLNNFRKTDSEIKKLYKELRSTNTLIITTADHGMIDIPKKNMIFIKNHPKLKETLLTTMGGQSRYVNCYVKDIKKFKQYINKHFKRKLIMLTNKKAQKLYGNKKSSKKIKERIGDYVLIAKKNYAIYDFPIIQNYKTYEYNTCDHGGLTKEEMLVPLIVLKIK